MPITTLNMETAATDASTRRALASLSSTVVKSRRIIVVTGAGISCSCGIPDFRSSDGLYNLVKQQYPDVVIKGRDLFDASLFRDKTSTAVFYTFISGLKMAIDNASPSPTHHFLQTLHKRGKLLRSYTQNIDGLEERSGLVGTGSPSVSQTEQGTKPKIGKDVKNIQLHGDIHRVRCTVCSASYPCAKEHVEVFQQGSAPDCPECKQRCDERVARSARPVRVGTLRPAIVLYDEPHPLGDDIATIQTADLGKRPDLLIIMGTSLKVHGLKKLVKEFAKAVHAGSSTSSATPKVIFVNKTAPAAEWSGVIDVHVEGTTDAWVDKVTADWKHVRPADWEAQPTLKDVLSTVNVKPKPKPVAATGPKPTKAKAPKRANSNEENIPPAATSSKSPTEASTKKPLVSSKPALGTKASSSSRVFASAASVKSKTSKVPATVAPISPSKQAVKRPSTPVRDITVLPVPPLSPSKRQNVESHYTAPDGEEAPPRKRQRSLDFSADAEVESLAI